MDWFLGVVEELLNAATIRHPSEFRTNEQMAEFPHGPHAGIDFTIVGGVSLFSFGAALGNKGKWAEAQVLRL